MKNKTLILRLCAYIFDMIFISFIISLLYNNTISNPTYKVTNIYEDELFNLISSNPININSISLPIYNYIRSLNYYYFYYLIVTFLYFVIFEYFTGGYTLGMKLYHIKIVNKSSKKVTFFNLIKKYPFIGCHLLIGMPITILLQILGLYIFNYNSYINYYALLNFITLIFEIINFIYLYKKSILIQDKISNTKIINEIDTK